MNPLNDSLRVFKEVLKNGEIQVAYRGIFQYLTKIKKNIAESSDQIISTGSIYHGYLDMSYFPILTKTLKDKRLKVALVFNYDTFNLEAWLSGNNRKISKEIWSQLSNIKLDKYTLVENIEKSDAIIVNVLNEEVDLEDEKEIQDMVSKTIRFIEDVEGYITGRCNQVNQLP